jgi:hypothetical protein
VSIAVVLLTAAVVVVVALLAAAGAGKLARLDGATYPAAVTRAPGATAVGARRGTVGPSMSPDRPSGPWIPWPR